MIRHATFYPLNKYSVYFVDSSENFNYLISGNWVSILNIYIYTFETYLHWNNDDFLPSYTPVLLHNFLYCLRSHYGVFQDRSYCDLLWSYAVCNLLRHLFSFLSNIYESSNEIEPISESVPHFASIARSMSTVQNFGHTVKRNDNSYQLRKDS